MEKATQPRAFYGSFFHAPAYGSFEYLERALSRAHALGIELAVFGSGGARGVPEGFSYAEAWRQIASFLRRAADYGRKYGIAIAIEPLRREECNILNYVSEAVLLSALLDLPEIGALGDTLFSGRVKDAFIRLRVAHIFWLDSLGA